MPLTITGPGPAAVISLGIDRILPDPFSTTIYGDPSGEIDDLIESIREHGVLVPLVVAPTSGAEGEYRVVSGHRRLACARALGLPAVPCEVRRYGSSAARRRAILEYNRQRRKTFSQMMREADAFETVLASEARRSRLANLLQFRDAPQATERRNSDARRPGAATATGRTDTTIARAIGLGGKDLYRQARTLWRIAQSGDPRAQSCLAALDAGTKTIHAAYKDLRRRDRFTTDFRPTPYDVWPFRHDRAFGIPHPGAIPPAIIAHTLHYYTSDGALVVDPMAGGGTTIDVCESMGRRCLAYDLHPVRPDITHHDVRSGFPPETSGCDLIFCDPPYHTMRAHCYGEGGVDTLSLDGWIAFLERLGQAALATLRPGGRLALLLANQTEKDLPAGWGYLDHAFLGYEALRRAGFLPERRISCPMDGAYLPQHIQRARAEGRMLGQVRDLVVMRKPRAGNDSGRGLAPREFVDLAPHEGIGESRVAADQRLGE